MLNTAPAKAPWTNGSAALSMSNFEDLMQEPNFRCPEARTTAVAEGPAGARNDDAGAVANMPAWVPLPGVSADVAIRDWDDLLCAVKARLRLIAGERLGATPEARAHDTAVRVQAGVVDCVAALDQLHTTLTNELARREQLELQVFDARASLALVRAEIAGSGADRHLIPLDSVASLSKGSFFHARVDYALARAERDKPALAVLHIDLDGFAPIKETHGHGAADELLMIIAARLTRAVRAQDTVSRLRSDQFACLLVHVSGREPLSRLACKLLDAVAAPVKIGDAKFSVRPSIGIAMGTTDGASTDALLKNADAAMARAKRRQTGYAFFDEPADAPVHGSE